MNLRIAKKLATLSRRDRSQVSRFLENRNLRIKVAKEFQARGIGVGIEPDKIEKWLEIILKYLPLFIEIILKFI